MSKKKKAKKSVFWRCVNILFVVSMSICVFCMFFVSDLKTLLEEVPIIGIIFSVAGLTLILVSIRARSFIDWDELYSSGRSSNTTWTSDTPDSQSSNSNYEHTFVDAWGYNRKQGEPFYDATGELIRPGEKYTTRDGSTHRYTNYDNIDNF